MDGSDPSSSPGSVEHQSDGPYPAVRPAVTVGRHEPLGDAGPESDVRILPLVTVLLKRWRTLVAVSLGLGIVVAAIQFLFAPGYTATATFFPERSGSSFQLPGSLAGLASQFGISTSGGGATGSQFYADLLKSREITYGVLLAEFPDPREDTPGATARLVDILDVDADNEAELLETGERELGRMVGVSVSRLTDLVRISVTTEYPVLSAQVVGLFLELLGDFNLNKRQSSARELRRFMETRVTAAESELTAAEDDLGTFLRANRQFDQSPDLQFEHDRLQRQVRLKEQVLTSLNTQLEEVRIQELNDTPMVTVVDSAVVPQEKSKPQRRRNVLLALILGGGLGLVVAIVQEYAERARQVGDPDFEALSDQWHRSRAEWLRLLPFRSRKSGS